MSISGTANRSWKKGSLLLFSSRTIVFQECSGLYRETSVTRRYLAFRNYCTEECPAYFSLITQFPQSTMLMSKYLDELSLNSQNRQSHLFDFFPPKTEQQLTIVAHEKTQPAAHAPVKRRRARSDGMLRNEGSCFFAGKCHFSDFRTREVLWDEHQHGLGCSAVMRISIVSINCLHISSLCRRICNVCRKWGNSWMDG